MCTQEMKRPSVFRRVWIVLRASHVLAVPTSDGRKTRLFHTCVTASKFQTEYKKWNPGRQHGFPQVCAKNPHSVDWDLCLHRPLARRPRYLTRIKTAGYSFNRYGSRKTGPTHRPPRMPTTKLISGQFGSLSHVIRR
jgi:hypothetical protein